MFTKTFKSKFYSNLYSEFSWIFFTPCKFYYEDNRLSAVVQKWPDEPQKGLNLYKSNVKYTVKLSHNVHAI